MRDIAYVPSPGIAFLKGTSVDVIQDPACEYDRLTKVKKQLTFLPESAPGVTMEGLSSMPSKRTLLSARYLKVWAQISSATSAVLQSTTETWPNFSASLLHQVHEGSVPGLLGPRAALQTQQSCQAQKCSRQRFLPYCTTGHVGIWILQSRQSCRAHKSFSQYSAAPYKM